LANWAPQKPAAHHDVGVDDAVLGLHAGDSAARLYDAEHLGVRPERRAACRGEPRLRFGSTHGLGETVGGRVESAENSLAVQQRVQVHTFSGTQQSAVDPPRRAPAGLAVQVRPAVRGGGDLETTDGVEGPAVRMVKGAEFFDGVARERAHGLERVCLEHQTVRVRCRSTGREQRPAIQHGDVGKPTGGQFISKRGADDAGADHDDFGHRPHS
jgi:hypothetical protein